MPMTKELASLLHIIMTPDVEWDPSQYDKELDDLAGFLILPKKLMKMNTLTNMGSNIIALWQYIIPA
jgi:hypothetical protein